MKFMLTDDDRDDADLFQEALGSIDPTIQFSWAENGKAALEKLDSEQPDIIFLDINMPIMNGWKFLEEVKSRTSYQHIPVIMFTTSSHQKEIDAALDQQALCFVTKPDDFKELKQLLLIVKENLHSDLCGALTKLKNVFFRK